jgi:hypothetical protein
VGVSTRTRQPFRNIGDTVTMMNLCRLFNHQILRQYCVLAKEVTKIEHEKSESSPISDYMSLDMSFIQIINSAMLCGDF